MAEDQLVEDKAVLPLELFFDLVFVLGITQTVAVIIEGHDAEALWKAALVLSMLWWAWTQFTWTANSIDLRPPHTRIAFFVAMGAALVMAVSVPTAFGDGGIWFAAGYVVVRAVGVWLQLTETKDDPELLASIRLFAAVSWPGPAVFLIGGLVDTPARTWLWILGGLLEIGSAAIVGGKAWHLKAGHFAERHGLIYIIALGEGIVAVGIVATGQEFGGVLVASMLLAVAGASALWWSYFDSFLGFIEHKLRHAGDDQGVLARDAYSLGHFPMIAGVVLFAAAAEEVVLHPADPLGGFSRMLLALAICLVLLSQTLIILRAGGPIMVERVVAAVAVAVLLVPEIGWRGDVALLVVLAITVAAMTVEWRANRLEQVAA